MAIKKLRKHRMNENGEYDVLHYETDAALVVMEDGSSVEDTIAGLAREDHDHTSVIETKAGAEHKFWRGTKAEYDAIEVKDDDTMYIVLDDDGNGISQIVVNSINGQSGDVVLTASDVGARPNTWIPTAAEVGAMENKGYLSNYSTVLAAATLETKTGYSFFAVVDGGALVDAPDAPFGAVEVQYFVLVDGDVARRRTVLAFRYGYNGFVYRDIFDGNWLTDWMEYATKDYVLPRDGSAPMSGVLDFKQVENGFGRVFKHHTTSADNGLYIQDYAQDGKEANLLLSATDGQAAFYANKYGTWHEILHTGNKNLITPTDIGAQPASTAINTSNIGSQSVNYANSTNWANNAGNADTVDGLHAWYLGTLDANGNSHGTGFPMYCKHNVYGDGRFALIVDGHEVIVQIANYAHSTWSAHQTANADPGSATLKNISAGTNDIGAGAGLATGQLYFVYE